MRTLMTTLTCSLFVASTAMAQSRGELLYKTHCIACHTTEVHWRDKRLVNDQASLQAQVRRWQAAVSLAWDDTDILEVSRYLSESIYRFEPAAAPEASMSTGTKRPLPGRPD